MSNYRFITASDSNPTYCGFIPSWISHHKKLYPESEVKVILVSDTLPNELLEVQKDVILFKPIPDMQTSYQAQLVRMVYGALLSDKQNIICDMDMYVLNKDLLSWFDRIPNYDDRFINYGCLSMNACCTSSSALKVFSIFPPFDKFLSFVLTNAFPFPGFTC